MRPKSLYLYILLFRPEKGKKVNVNENNVMTQTNVEINERT